MLILGKNLVKKRLRKKLHVKEFTEFGIDFDFSVNTDISGEEFDLLCDRFVYDFVEGNGLYCGGGWNPKERSASFIVEIGQNMGSFDYYTEKLQSWFESEGIILPATYKIVDLWNDKEF